MDYNYVKEDTVFIFPVCKFKLHYKGIEKDIIKLDKKLLKKCIVEDDSLIIRFMDLKCLLYNAELFIGWIYDQETNVLLDKEYEIQIFSRDDNIKPIYKERAEALNNEARIKVNICQNDKLKELICRVLFKDIPFQSTKDRTWDFVKNEPN